MELEPSGIHSTFFTDRLRLALEVLMFVGVSVSIFISDLVFDFDSCLVLAFGCTQKNRILIFVPTRSLLFIMIIPQWYPLVNVLQSRNIHQGTAG